MKQLPIQLPRVSETAAEKPGTPADLPQVANELSRGMVRLETILNFSKTQSR